jgi:hypothetical protein
MVSLQPQPNKVNIREWKPMDCEENREKQGTDAKDCEYSAGY